MLVAERYHKIVQLVNERGSIRVTELSSLCGVTEETIRRDLDKLEQQGKLQRSHGGAISIKEHQAETPYNERETTNAEEKRKIASEAVACIKPRDRIFLDASSTAWYMAAAVPDIPLTVLTNSIKVALELADKKSIQVISTGGILASRSLSYTGPLAERSLESYHVNKAFISCKGVHVDRGLSEGNENQARLKQKMLEIADQVYVLADYSKFGIRAFAHVADWQHIHYVITDSKASSEQLQILREKSVQVIQLAE